MRVDFGARRSRFGSRGFVCQTKKVNSRGHIPERLVGQSEAKLGLAKKVRIFLKRFLDAEKIFRKCGDF